MRLLFQSRRRAGYGLVEALVALTILGLVLGSVAMVGKSSHGAYQTGITNAHLEAQAEIAIGRILDELRGAGLETLVPAPTPGLGTHSLSYAQATDLMDGEIVWTPPRSLEFAYEWGELDDGLDNNGNGLVDEGRVLLTEDLGGPNERQLVLTRWVAEAFAGELPNGLDDNGNGLVDERGFCVERIDEPAGETLLVRLSLERRDEGGRLLVRAVQTSIRIRN